MGGLGLGLELGLELGLKLGLGLGLGLGYPTAPDRMQQRTARLPAVQEDPRSHDAPTRFRDYNLGFRF